MSWGRCAQAPPAGLVSAGSGKKSGGVGQSSPGRVHRQALNRFKRSECLLGSLSSKPRRSNVPVKSICNAFVFVEMVGIPCGSIRLKDNVFCLYFLTSHLKRFNTRKPMAALRRRILLPIDCWQGTQQPGGSVKSSTRGGLSQEIAFSATCALFRGIGMADGITRRDLTS